MFKKFWVVLFISILLLLTSGCSGDDVTPTSKEVAIEQTDTSTEDIDDNTAEEKSEETLEESISVDATYAEGFKHDITVVTNNSLELSQKSYDFIVSNHTLLPAMTDGDVTKVKSLVDPSISYKLLNKNVAPYYSKFASFTGNVVSVEETQIESGDTVSLTHVIDDEFNSYQVFMYKGTGDILEEDRVQFWGIPVGVTSFENVSGGTTNVQLFFGSHIEKSE